MLFLFFGLIHSLRGDEPEDQENDDPPQRDAASDPRRLHTSLTCHGSSKHTSIFRQIYKVEQSLILISCVGLAFCLCIGRPFRPGPLRGGGGVRTVLPFTAHLKGDYEPANYFAHSSKIK